MYIAIPLLIILVTCFVATLCYLEMAHRENLMLLKMIGDLGAQNEQGGGCICVGPRIG